MASGGHPATKRRIEGTERWMWVGETDNDSLAKAQNQHSARSEGEQVEGGGRRCDGDGVNLTCVNKSTHLVERLRAISSGGQAGQQWARKSSQRSGRANSRLARLARCLADSNCPRLHQRLVATACSAASTLPPLATITTSFPLNGTYCLAANVMTTNIATVPEGTGVVRKPCISADLTQQWGIRDGDGTIRLWNQNLCLNVKIGSGLAPQYATQMSTCVVGFVECDMDFPNDRKRQSKMDTHTQAPRYGPNWLRSEGVLLPSYSRMVKAWLNRHGNIPGRFRRHELSDCRYRWSGHPHRVYIHDGIIGAGEQDFTFGAGSSSVGKGTPGSITALNGKYCLDVLAQITNLNNTSIDYLGANPCNGSLTQQWQVNNDSTISLANTNRCICQPTKTLDLNTKLQIADCIPGNANQNWMLSG
ncbi:hypothetical protein K438DRAFT_1755426 [Mycena galopus ATCC 62051]|nr:hypothetical protein K438DRAFT_1755426 [Mycena galopus ATCC 62051]